MCKGTIARRESYISLIPITITNMACKPRIDPLTLVKCPPFSTLILPCLINYEGGVSKNRNRINMLGLWYIIWEKLQGTRHLSHRGYLFLSQVPPLGPFHLHISFGSSIKEEFMTLVIC